MTMKTINFLALLVGAFFLAACEAERIAYDINRGGLIFGDDAILYKAQQAAAHQEALLRAEYAAAQREALRSGGQYAQSEQQGFQWELVTVGELRTALDTWLDPRWRDEDGFTPLHGAAQWSKTPGVVKALLDAGADVHARDNGGFTALHHAAQFGNAPGVVKVLLDYGADVNARGDDGSMPLILAAVYSGSPGIVKVLLDYGADVGAKDRDGDTPLHYAAYSSKTPGVVKALLDGGADVLAENDAGYTPLHMATNNKTSAVVEVLAEAAQMAVEQDDGNARAEKETRGNITEAIDIEEGI